MQRRELLALLVGAAAVPLACPLAANAQRAGRIRRIGVLFAVSQSDQDVRTGLDVFLQSFQSLGWTEGRDFEIEYRWGDADTKRMGAFAKELVERSPDILLAHSTPPVVALLRETRLIPIVFLTVTDPVGQGLVANLAQPGGNVTGFSVFEISLGSKWLEILKEIAPDIKRATIIYNPTTAPYYPLYLRAIREAAASFAIEPVPVEVHSDADIERVISSVGGAANGGLFVLPDSFNVVHRKTIIEASARHRVPAIYYFKYFAKDGGLISYGPDEMDLFRRTAGYVDRILKGAQPTKLPVQQPSKFEMVVNLKTAKALGLKVEESFLRLADEVIE